MRYAHSDDDLCVIPVRGQAASSSSRMTESTSCVRCRAHVHTTPLGMKRTTKAHAIQHATCDMSAECNLLCKLHDRARQVRAVVCADAAWFYANASGTVCVCVYMRVEGMGHGGAARGGAHSFQPLPRAELSVLAQESLSPAFRNAKVTREGVRPCFTRGKRVRTTGKRTAQDSAVPEHGSASAATRMRGTSVAFDGHTR